MTDAAASRSVARSMAPHYWQAGTVLAGAVDGRNLAPEAFAGPLSLAVSTNALRWAGLISGTEPATFVGQGNTAIVLEHKTRPRLCFKVARSSARIELEATHHLRISHEGVDPTAHHIVPMLSCATVCEMVKDAEGMLRRRPLTIMTLLRYVKVRPTRVVCPH